MLPEGGKCLGEAEPDALSVGSTLLVTWGAGATKWRSRPSVPPPGLWRPPRPYFIFSNRETWVGVGGEVGTQCVIPADRPNLAGPGRGLDAGAQKAATRAAEPALGPGGAGTPNSRRRPASGPGQRAP